ncbi:hypothetical protein ACTJJ0_15000 [Chitinophaga sp. 22321]|uniref:VanZ like family protein n=1 Tax=Chitinophaga hostae TaxID=2831022 RepID=A0ABS5J2I4_9BACT|nr:hypothetical protein [Chitinophaga hostae]MBS0029256.1 hypothetical protein [Chitinophaga hostae]
MKRILIAAISGCVILFIWGAFSHLVLFIGAGFTPLPNEDTVIRTLQNTLPKQGLYFFPGKDFRRTTAGQESTFEKKFKTGPVGMVIYRPVGGNPLSLGKLGTQFTSNFITSLIISFIVSLLAASYWKRVFAVSLLAALACASVSTIYWNWYEFPTSFFLAQCIDQVVGCMLAGLAIAKIVPSAINRSNKNGR